MSLLLKRVTIVTMDEIEPIIDGYVFIKNGFFTIISHGEPSKELCDQADRTIDTKGKWLIPGLINTHGHTGMTLLRGHSDDLPLHRWLNEKMWPFEAKQDRQAVQVGRDLALAEMIKAGTTTFLEMYHLYMDDFAEVIEQVGIRATLMRSMIGLCPIEEQETKLKEAVIFAETWHKKANGRIQAMLAPHAPYTCPPTFIERIVEEAERLNLPVHMHLAETKKEIEDHISRYGLHPLDQLDKNGLLKSVDWLFAHCVHLTDEHLDMIKSYEAAISHNPISNLKLGSGIAPVASMLDKGITVSIGTDSVASNNTLDLFEEIRMTGLIHKGIHQNPTLIPAKSALGLATINGAKSLHYQYIGQIRQGFEADFLLISPEGSHLQPNEHVISHLVYAVKSADVTDVFVQGRPLMENRQLLTIDEEKVRSEANIQYRRICQMI